MLGRYPNFSPYLIDLPHVGRGHDPQLVPEVALHTNVTAQISAQLVYYGRLLFVLYFVPPIRQIQEI
jgi:hypothetical protein